MRNSNKIREDYILARLKISIVDNGQEKILSGINALVEGSYKRTLRRLAYRAIHELEDGV